MRNRLTAAMGALTAVLVCFPAALSEPDQPAAQTKPAAPAPKRDLSGVWQLQGYGGAEGLAPDKDMPPMTPWAQTRFEAEKPGYGPRAVADGNDPILQCDPSGFPRIMFFPTPFEFASAPGRLLQFFEREHEYRSIWTDGRSLPEDPDPKWYGYAVGHWEDDYTFVTEATGFDDRTWLGATGYPHSESMRVKESYRRADHDTLLYNITIDDPKAYTKPIVGPQRTYKLRPKAQIEELVCVWSEENAFARRIREPAATPRPK